MFTPLNKSLHFYVNPSKLTLVVLTKLHVYAATSKSLCTEVRSSSTSVNENGFHTLFPLGFVPSTSQTLDLD